MVPERLALRNFLSYRELDALELGGVHVACLVGPNGHGKSTLIDAMTWALFGASRLGARRADELVRHGSEEMLVDLEFRSGGQRYRVVRKHRRGRAKTAGATTLEFMVADGAGGWTALPGSTIDETERAIRRVLRLDYDTFVNSALLLQGKSDKFTRTDPRERRRVLAAILRLDRYERLEQRARGRARDLEDEVQRLEGEAVGFREQAAREPDLAGGAADAGRDAERARAALEEARAEREACGSEVERLRALAGQLTAARSALAALAVRRDEAVRAVAAAEAEAHDARAAADTLPDLRARAAQLEEARRRLEDARRREQSAAELAREALHAQELLDARRRQHAFETDSLRRALREAEEAAAQAEERRRELDDTEREAEKVRERKEGLAAGLGARQAVEERWRELLAVRDALARLQGLEREHAEDARELAAAEGLLQEALARLRGELDERARRLEAAQTAAAELPAVAAALQAALDARRSAEKARDEVVARLGAAIQDARERAASEGQRARAAEAGARDAARRLQELAGVEGGRCPLCRNELGPEGLQHVRGEWQRERERATAVARDATDAATAAEREAGHLDSDSQREAASGNERVRMAVEEETRARQRLDAVRAAQLEAERLAAEAAATPPLEDHPQVREARARVGVVVRRLEELDTALARRAELTAQAQELAGVEAERALLERAVTDLAEADEMQVRLEGRRARLQEELRAAGERADQVDARRAAVAAAEEQLEEQYAAAEVAARAGVERALAELAFDPAEVEAATAAVERMVSVEAEVRAAEIAAARLPDLERLLADRQGALARLGSDMAQAEAGVRELEEAVAPLAEAQAAFDTAQQGLRDAEEQAGRAGAAEAAARERLELAKEAVARLRDAEGRLERTRRRGGVYLQLAEAFGPKGIQALLIEHAVPELTNHANELLDRLTGGRLRVDLRTQRTTRQGGVVEALDIVVTDEGGERAYELLSGGEAFRVDVALRVALARLLARRAGAPLRTLVMDEGFGTQDTEGRERLLEAIQAIASDFDLVLVVTHLDDLKASFPAWIEVQKDADGSHAQLVYTG